MSTPSKQTTVAQPTRSRSKPKTQLQRTRTKTTDKSPTKSRKLPTRAAVVSPAESGKTSRPRAARKTTSYFEDIDFTNIFDSDSEEDQETATMSEPVAPEPTHEIETVERSSIQADTEKKKDEAFEAAMKQKSAEREPVQGHEVPLTRKLTEAEMQHYRSKFREAFPDATPAMMEDVNKVLNQEAHPDADAKLDVIVIDWAIKPPPAKQADIGNGNKGEPRTEHCASGLGNPCLTSRRMALYLLPYLTFHRLLRDTCLVVKATGTKRKDTCKCTSNFCKHLRKCLHILGGKDDIVAVKLFKLAVIPLLTELIETQRMIIDGDNDEAAFHRYVFGKMFVKKKKTSNKTPHTIFQLGGRDFSFCASSAIEVLGRQTSQQPFQKFHNRWITNNNYLMQVLRHRGFRSKMTCFTLECFAEMGEPKTWTEVVKDGEGKKNELKATKLVYNQLIQKGLMIGVELQKKTFHDHMATLRSVYDPMVEAQVLVIAHPKCGQEFEGQLADPFWSILFQFKGKLSYRSANDGVITHMCNGGAVKVDPSAPFMKAMFKGFLLKAGPGGRKNLNASPPPTPEAYEKEKKIQKCIQNCGSAGGAALVTPQRQPPTPVTAPQFFLNGVNGSPRVLFTSSAVIPHNPFGVALRMTGFSNEEARQFMRDGDDCLGGKASYRRILDFCENLLPEGVAAEGKLKSRSQATFLLNGRDVHDGKFMPQMLHTDFTADKLQEFEESGIWPFFVIIPLTDEGSWLMTCPTFDTSADIIPEKKMIFVPIGNALVLPGTTIHAGGFNTGSMGNPRIHLTIYLFKEDNEKEALKVIGDGKFVSEWIGFNEETETQSDETEEDPFRHTFVAVDWTTQPQTNKKRGAKRKATGQTNGSGGDDEEVEVPVFTIPENPNLHAGLYDLTHVTPLMNFIGH